MSELDAALAVEPKQPVRTERNFALTKGIAGAVRCGTQARCPFRVCAGTRRRFPVGASPTRQPLQPEATGAAMEVTKWLKPSDSASRIGDGASVQAVTRVNAEQASKRTMRKADPTTLSGKADTAG